MSDWSASYWCDVFKSLSIWQILQKWKRIIADTKVNIHIKEAGATRCKDDLSDRKDSLTGAKPKCNVIASNSLISWLNSPLQLYPRPLALEEITWVCKAGAGLFHNYLTIDSKGCFEAATLNLAPFCSIFVFIVPFKTPRNIHTFKWDRLLFCPCVYK